VSGKLRLVKVEREVVRMALAEWNPLKQAWVNAKESTLDKLDRSELIRGKGRPSTATPIRDVMRVFSGVLGRRLIPPPSSGRQIWAQMQRRVDALGVDLEGCRELAEEAGRRWQGSIKAESIVRQAERLQHPLDTNEGNREVSERTPVEMEEL
jgi:hypothetical protein